MPGKVLRAPPVPHLLRRQLHQIFQDFFHHLVLGETVHKVQRRLLAADQEFPSQKVEAGPKAYLFFEHGRIGFIPARQRPKFVAHRCPPFLRLPVQSDLVYPKTEGSRARREYFPKNIVIPGDFCYDRDKVNFEEAISMADEYTPNPNVPETPPEVPSEPAPPAMTPPPAPQPPSLRSISSLPPRFRRRRSLLFPRRRLIRRLKTRASTIIINSSSRATPRRIILRPSAHRRIRPRVKLRAPSCSA